MLTLSAAIMFAGISAAPQDAIPGLKPTTKWTVDYADSSCDIGRTFAGPDKQVTLLMRLLPGQGNTLFAIEERRAGKARVQTGDLTITPMPGAGPFTIQATSGSAKAGSYVLYGSLSEEELAAITKAGSVSFAYRGDVIQLTGMNLKVALAAAEPCENDLLRTWGIDPAAFRSIAVRAKPTASPANWVQSHDYPSAALIAGEQGTVGVRLDIDATGKLLTCTVMSSSKSAALDHRTCEMVRRRARYEPARSADNTAVASISFLRFRWQIVP